MSTSVIWLAATVTVQVVADGSGAAGVSVNEPAGEALRVNVCGKPVGHCRSNALTLALTLSLKLTTMAELTETPLAEFAGVVLTTDGAVSGGTVVNENEKSAAMLSGGSAVSVSVIRPALTLTLQIVPAGRSDVGSSVKEVAGEP